MYRLMLFIRRNDEKICEIYTRRGLPELPHSSQGEEAIPVGSAYKLQQGDYVLPSLRSRGYFYVMGITPDEMMAGMFGKKTGPAGGRATSHHMGDLTRGVLSGSGLVGSSIPIATGAALGLKQQGRPNVVITSFGDGATSRGDFHESLNLAAIWDLPVIFICENNEYAMSTPTSRQMKIAHVADRAKAYGMPGVIVDGQDVLAVFDGTQEAIARARRGEGPTLIECKTKRWRGHSEKDKGGYRDQTVEEEIRKADPVLFFQRYLLERSILTEELIKDLEALVIEQIEESVRFAEESPYPDPADCLTEVFAM
ncbi:hypothetical protein SY88_15590 [Clostridiales bacterium PH28_bin88]|nr:hypothetical protein SY88_15590 [Clostridiales bacterium PH28_bin88]